MAHGAGCCPSTDLLLGIDSGFRWQSQASGSSLWTMRLRPWSAHAQAFMIEQVLALMNIVPMYETVDRGHRHTCTQKSEICIRLAPLASGEPPDSLHR
eukprot:8333631-Pyramimonas_sp.AAC.1